MEFDPAAASPCFVNQPNEQPRDVKHFDPWAVADPYMGRPRQVEDISQVDFRDAEFRSFAFKEFRTPRKIISRTYDELCGRKDFIVGTSDDE